MTTAHHHSRRRDRLDGALYGLLMTILALFQRALKDLAASEFALVMRRFLGVSRTHPLNYGLVTTSLLAPIVALVLLRGSAGDPEFVLVLAGLLVFVAVRYSCRSSSPSRSTTSIWVGRSGRHQRAGKEHAFATSASTWSGALASSGLCSLLASLSLPNRRRCSNEHRSDGE